MHKHNKFLILLICVALAFLVSCMDTEKEQTETTEPQAEGVLTQSPVTEAPSTSALPETSAVGVFNTTEAPKTEAPVTTATGPVVTTALPLPQTRTEQVTSAPVTIAPVTTTEHKEEPSDPSDKYDEGILKDILYTADEDGNWAGLGKYITNPELLGDVEQKVILRSKMAYDEVNSILNGEENERTLTDVYNSFKAKVKSSLLESGIEFTEIDAVGYEIIKLK